MRTYYLLAVKFDKGDLWAIDFGDYSKAVVKQEIEDSYSDCHKTKIVTTTEKHDYKAILADLNNQGV